MKKLSEVCKLVGVTRRTLQEYDKIGLLKHTAETEGGYWLYDDSALNILFAIQVFVEAGYKRLEIKEMLNDDNINIENVFEEVTLRLAERKKRIEGLINQLELFKSSLMVSPYIREHFAKFELSNIYKNKSFMDALNEGVNISSKLSESAIEKTKVFQFLLYHFLAIGTLQKEGLDSDNVKRCISDFSQAVWDLIVSNNEPSEIKEYSSELLKEACFDLLKSPEIKKHMDEMIGDGTTEFVKQVINKYNFSIPIRKED